MMLGDLGATVIKVERPGTGDETRGWGPPFDARGESAYFLGTNRNKWSLAADLDDPADLELVRGLAGGADVIVDNFLPGVLARKGLDADVILSANTGAIWCTVQGYPADPSRPGYDFAVQAEAGWMSVNGEPGGVPMKTPVAFVDVLTGKDAAIAILAALVGARRASVAERRLRVTLAGSALAALVNVSQNVLVSGQEARRWGNAHANLVPYQLFQASDRPIVIAVGSDAQWRAFAAVLGDAAIAGESAWATNAGRVSDRERCVGAVQRVMATRPAEHWRAACAAAGVPVGMVRTVLEALAEVDASPLVGVPSGVGGRVFRAPPRLGEHSAAIRQHGWRVGEAG